MMTTIKEDGTCQLMDKDGELLEVRTSGPMVSTALLIREGNNQYSKIKLENKEKLQLFPYLIANEKNLKVFLHPEVSLLLQIYQQYFNVLKP